MTLLWSSTSGSMFGQFIQHFRGHLTAQEWVPRQAGHISAADVLS